MNVVLRYANRYFVELPTISWAEEAIRYGIIWTTFLAAANAFRRESHFGVDIIFRVKSAPFVKFIRLLDDVGAFVFCSLPFSLLLYNHNEKELLYVIVSCDETNNKNKKEAERYHCTCFCKIYPLAG